MGYDWDRGEAYAESTRSAIDAAQRDYDLDPDAIREMQLLHRDEATGRSARAAVRRRRLERLKVEIAAQHSDLATDIDPADIKG